MLKWYAKLKHCRSVWSGQVLTKSHKHLSESIEENISQNETVFAAFSMKIPHPTTNGEASKSTRHHSKDRRHAEHVLFVEWYVNPRYSYRFAWWWSESFGRNMGSQGIRFVGMFGLGHAECLLAHVCFRTCAVW